MIIKRINIDEILCFLGDQVKTVWGLRNNVYIDNLADVAHTNATTLDWVLPSKPEKQQIVETSKALVLLVDEGVVFSETLQKAKKTLIVVSSPKRALAEIGNHFFIAQPVAGIHPTAVIDPNAVIGQNVSIGAYTVIGKAVIGDHCVIDANVRIYDAVEMGVGCNVKAGAVLGGAGFGFERDAEGNRFRFPQIGRLLIGDDVEIGANTCIDRGALSDTMIGNHTKINNLCHIAHNNVIGNNVAIAGCVNLSGGNIIEDDVWIAPNASLMGYVHIGENAMVGMGAVVVKDIPDNEVWIGNPAKKLRNK